MAAHNDDVELYRTPSLSTGAIDASIVMASSDSLLGVVVELALADEPCWSRSRERPFNSRTRTPTRRNPIESRSAGTRWRRCSTVEAALRKMGHQVGEVERGEKVGHGRHVGHAPEVEIAVFRALA